jgi:hypothetical protein
MKPSMHRIILGLNFFVLISICCNKKFDSPPEYIGPNIHPNFSIRDLRAMHLMGSFEHIVDDYIIEGVVVADDRKDNFYKSIVVEDSTGGITIRMDANGLYTDYPVGRKVAIKLRNLWMSDYARMIQLGAGIDQSNQAFLELAPIPVPLFDRYIVKKELNNVFAAKHVRLDELHDSLQSRLITIDNLEFAIADTGKTYADAVNKLSVNATVKSCAGGSTYIRTSGFANFAAAKIPRGNGSITAIYTVFRSEKQLLIRDTSDVQLNGLRCTAPGTKLLLEENFERAIPNTELNLSGWRNIAETGSVSYIGKTADNNVYAEISAFATGRSGVVSWLILPPVNLNNSANEVLGFITKDGFDNGAVLQVFASANYDGGNMPWKAKWTLLKSLISKGSVSTISNDWVSSGNISLAGFSGIVHIAFRYDGADPASVLDKRTTTFQLDNLRIVGN